MKSFYVNNNYLNNESISAVYRTKFDIVTTILSIARYINNFKLLDSKYSEQTRLIIYIDKMSRIFLLDKNKIHSFQFPFSISDENDEIKLMHKDDIVENTIVYPLIAIFADIENNIHSWEELLDLFANTMNDYNIHSKYDMDLCWSILIHLLTFEPGYLRYDIDNDLTRLDKLKHPLNHLDIFYSNNTTFKLGLEKDLSHYDLIDILDIKTCCKFIK